MCVLHVGSETKSFSEFLKTTTLPVYATHEKGSIRHPRRQVLWDDYGFSCDFSEKDWSDLDGQIEDACAFLRRHGNEFRRLRDMYPENEAMIWIDFPYYCRLGERVVAQSDYLPPEFLQLVGNLGIGVEMTLYQSPQEESQDNSAGS